MRVYYTATASIVVQPFDEPDSRVEGVANFLYRGWVSGAPLLVVARPINWALIHARLKAKGCPVAEMAAEGRLVVLDAVTTLASFFEDSPEPGLFHEQIGATVGRLSKFGRLYAYGEMVDILAEQARFDTAHELEMLWNQLAARESITLLCGYASAHFGDVRDAEALHRSAARTQACRRTRPTCSAPGCSTIASRGITPNRVRRHCPRLGLRPDAWAPGPAACYAVGPLADNRFRSTPHRLRRSAPFVDRPRSGACLGRGSAGRSDGTDARPAVAQSRRPHRSDRHDSVSAHLAGHECAADWLGEAGAGQHPRAGPNWRQKFMLVAAAGPASNLVLAVDCRHPGARCPGGTCLGAFESAVYINILLALFNMVPVPPLDGGNVLSGLLTGSMAETFDKLRPYGFLILYGLMLSGILWTIVSPPASLLVSWLL